MRNAAPARSPWPPAALIDLAAGRDPGPLELTRELVELAADHRVDGLLWSWARQHADDGPMRSTVAMRDLRIQGHLVRLWGLVERCVADLRRAGIEVASLKGPIAGARWYSRPGERPSSDVDLWLSPHQLDRARDAVEVLQPDHPWSAKMGDLVRHGFVQTVTLKVDGIEVDLHLDPLKTGVVTRRAKDLWDSCELYPLPGGDDVRVLRAEGSLLLFLLHMNKDRFQRLLGYADVARIIASGVDVGATLELADAEGLGVPVRCALDTVVRDLALDRPRLSRPVGVKALMWRLTWGRRVRLRGSEGRRRFKKRQLLIPALADGRWREALRFYALEMFPPEPALEAHAHREGRRVSRIRRVFSQFADARRGVVWS